jgi:predicted RNA-binding Zn-ribbon protein involved in translation (DUF1610 family)
MGGIGLSAVERTIGYSILGLFGVLLFMIGGSIVIWALHFLMWNPPSSDFINNLPSDIAWIYPIATPLGLFLIGFAILLLIWSGAGLSFNSQTVSVLRNEAQEKTQATVSVEAHCPHCNAVYSYRLPKTKAARRVTCQNCGFQFEVVKSPDGTGATG